MTSQVLNVVPIELDRIFEAAVILSWNELMPETPLGLIHVEYHGDEHALESLKVWASIQRGHWNLICEYVPKSGTTNRAELTFANGYESETLGQVLRFVIDRHQMFVASVRRGGAVALLQVHVPAETDKTGRGIGAATSVGRRRFCCNVAAQDFHPRSVSWEVVGNGGRLADPTNPLPTYHGVTARERALGGCFSRRDLTRMRLQHETIVCWQRGF